MLRLACLLAAWLAVPAIAGAAPGLEILSRFEPAAGVITDAALFNDGSVALAYPERGHLALYAPDGRLLQHMMREAGESLHFEPTTLIAGPKDTLLVFDEADHKLFTIQKDGNVSRGIDLAYPTEDGTSAVALSRIGDLALDYAERRWAMLPDRSMLAAFDDKGTLTERLDLSLGLPYPGAVFSRAQFAADGTLFVLDYHQGAVLHRPTGGEFRRLRPPIPTGSEAEPVLQDFAVDRSKNILASAAGGDNELLYLLNSPDGYRAHPLRLDLPVGPHRISVRHSQGKFIVWLRDTPLVFVLRLR